MMDPPWIDGPSDWGTQEYNMKIYTGVPESEEWGHVGAVMVAEGGKAQIPLNPRHDLVNHSPDGFGWGYCGSGAAQLAFAMLLDATGDEAYTMGIYQKFKVAIIAKLPRAPWTVTEEEIQEWRQNA